MRQILNRFFRLKQTQDIKELTDFLAQNETFKKTAKKIHTKKSSFFGNMDSYLEQELLGIKKETPKRIEDKSRLVQKSSGWSFWGSKK
eukprot:403331305